MDLSKIIKVPYNTRPHMSKNAEDVFNNNPDLLYISNKKHQLAMFGSDLYGETQEAVDTNLVKRVSMYLGKPVTNDIVELALNFEEDIAILHRGVLSAICFCFPSSWIPVKGVGKTLRELHHPVADGEHLRSASDKISNTISDPVLGSFRRYVWTVTKVPSLSNYYEIVDHFKDEELSLNTLYFRAETQTTLPLPDGNTSVFFVKVHVLPLWQVWTEYKDMLLTSINSMSDTVLEYKNLVEIKQFLNNCR